MPRKPAVPMDDEKAHSVVQILRRLGRAADIVNVSNRDERIETQRMIASDAAVLLELLHSEPGATTHLTGLAKLLGPACWIRC